MITAYLVGISTYHESESIEIRYCIYRDQELIDKTTLYRDYTKPLVVNLYALVMLLKHLEKYSDEEIQIFMNDTAIKEQIEGTSKTKNMDVVKMFSLAKAKLAKFKKSIQVIDVSKDSLELQKWNEILKV